MLCSQEFICLLGVQILRNAEIKDAKFVTIIDKLTTSRVTIQSN